MSKPIASLLHWAKRLTPSDQQFALYALSHMMDRNLSFCSYTPQAVLPRTTSKQAEQNHDLKCHTSCSDQTRFVHKAKLTLLLSHARAWSWARRVKSPDRVSSSPADDARKLATPNPSRKSNWRESTETCFVHQKRRWKQLTLKTSLTDSDGTSEELQTLLWFDCMNQLRAFLYERGQIASLGKQNAMKLDLEMSIPVKNSPTNF